eukprot:TRINITY_DN25288_c0_g1_i1.p1 TRINITY_DN25288_c0_g1~~TRINITY_DN25288_c0_g1_i1.p1  ORF type:complete len:314 (+),score=40.88 TRINITY_DN25288_c0_g1_i1:119-943(+)
MAVLVDSTRLSLAGDGRAGYLALAFALSGISLLAAAACLWAVLRLGRPVDLVGGRRSGVVWCIWWGLGGVFLAAADPFVAGDPSLGGGANGYLGVCVCYINAVCCVLYPCTPVNTTPSVSDSSRASIGAVAAAAYALLAQAITDCVRPDAHNPSYRTCAGDVQFAMIGAGAVCVACIAALVVPLKVDTPVLAVALVCLSGTVWAVLACGGGRYGVLGTGHAAATAMVFLAARHAARMGLHACPVAVDTDVDSNPGSPGATVTSVGSRASAYQKV